MAPKTVTIAQLEELAASSAETMAIERGEAVQCKYLGQRYGKRTDPKYHRSPS